MVTRTPYRLEAFETLKLRLIFTPCLILPEVSSEVMFTVVLKMLRQWGLRQSCCEIKEEECNYSLTGRVS
jgi:hypothetical protein